MKKETQKNTTSRKFYKVKMLDLHPLDGVDCALCSMWKVCNSKSGCKPNKNQLRNWKEFRKTQYKE